MTRIELELYADRLAATPSGCATTSRAARMRLAWAALEAARREQLGPRDCAVLEALGVLAACDEAAERRLVERRLRQLRAVERLQALVEREIEAAALSRRVRCRCAAPGASETSRPPSSSYAGNRSTRTGFIRPERWRISSGWSSLRTPHSSTTSTGLHGRRIRPGRAPR